MSIKDFKATIYAATLNAYLISNKKDSFELTDKDYELINKSVKKSVGQYYEMMDREYHKLNTIKGK